MLKKHLFFNYKRKTKTTTATLKNVVKYSPMSEGNLHSRAKPRGGITPL